MISRLFCLLSGAWPPVLCALLLLGACSPSYNWREVEVADGHAQAAFPDRVLSETRDITLAGQKLRFTLTMAEVDGAMFAVGHAPLPAAVAGDPAARQALGQALTQSLYANLGAAPPDPLPGVGVAFQVRGQGEQQARWLTARVWVTDAMLIDAVAAGTDDSLPLAQAQEFLRSVEIRN